MADLILTIKMSALEIQRRALVQQVEALQKNADVTANEDLLKLINELADNIHLIPVSDFLREHAKAERQEYFDVIQEGLRIIEKAVKNKQLDLPLELHIEDTNNVVIDFLESRKYKRGLKGFISKYITYSAIAYGVPPSAPDKIGQILKYLFDLNIGEIAKQVLSAAPILAGGVIIVAHLYSLIQSAFFSNEGPWTRVLKGILGVAGIAITISALVISAPVFAVIASAINVIAESWKVVIDLKSQFISGRWKTVLANLQENKELFYQTIAARPELIKELEAARNHPQAILSDIAKLDQVITNQENYLNKRKSQLVEKVESLGLAIISLVGAGLLLTPFTLPIGIALIVSAVVYMVANAAFNKLNEKYGWTNPIRELKNKILTALFGERFAKKEHHVSIEELRTKQKICVEPITTYTTASYAQAGIVDLTTVKNPGSDTVGEDAKNVSVKPQDVVSKRPLEEITNNHERAYSA